uniref:Transmembrane protein n=1 Tax=Medicago truncatula TaxID=3880 RepID=I3SEN4_MEDTR|nr:unknown [Medicago truncatula]
MCLINMLDMLVLEGAMVRHISMLKWFLKSFKGRVWLRGIGLFIACFKMSWILDFMLCLLLPRRLLKSVKDEIKYSEERSKFSPLSQLCLRMYLFCLVNQKGNYTC